MPTARMKMGSRSCTIQVGALKATVTVNVQGASGKLDAWIDFNRGRQTGVAPANRSLRRGMSLPATM